MRLQVAPTAHQELAEVFWNGKKMITSEIGWYVDEAIRKIALPGLAQGENLLEIHMPFESKTNFYSGNLVGWEGSRKYFFGALSAELWAMYYTNFYSKINSLVSQ